MDTISSYINAKALSLMSNSDSDLRIQLCSYVNFLTSQIYQNCKLYKINKITQFKTLYDDFLVNCNSLLTIMDILSQPIDEKSRQNLIQEFKQINYNHQMIHSNASLFLEQKLSDKPENNLIDNKKANEIISKFFILFVLYSAKLGAFSNDISIQYYMIIFIKGEGEAYKIPSFYEDCFGKYNSDQKNKKFIYSTEKSAKQGIEQNLKPDISARNPKVNIGLFVEKFNSQSIQFINKKFDEFVDNFKYMNKLKLRLNTSY